MKKNFKVAAIATVILSIATLTSCRLGSENPEVSEDILYGKRENTLLRCTDGIDNNGDTLIDCDDPDCRTTGTAEVPGPGNTVCPAEESTEYVCSDGKDNDGDGFIDCQDRSCKTTAACCQAKGEENTIEACSDGIDNDCNGYIDCADHSCSQRGPAEVVEMCKKKKCPAGTLDENTIETCSDGIDNDCNGFIDCRDFSCSKGTPETIEYCKLLNDPTYKPTIDVPNPHAVKEDTAELCSDGKDNDFSGLADCADPNCIALNLEYCSVELTLEPPPRPANFGSMTPEQRKAIIIDEYTLCTDNIDNDRNGLKDCNEYQCMLLSQQKLEGDLAAFQINCNVVTND